MRLAADATGAGRLERPDATITLDNPLCGDRVTVDIKTANGQVAELAQEVRACVLCQASASIVGEQSVGASADDLRETEAAVTAMLRDSAAPPDGRWSDMAVFESVRKFRSRHQCVLLPIEALRSALEKATGDSS